MNEEIITQESDDIVSNVDSENVFDNNENDSEEVIDDSEELELDGKVYKVPKAIKSSVMKNADYTQKTQELAREREAIAKIREEAQKSPTTIDYLSIDTEGSEYDILKSVNFDKWEFRIITVEHNYTANRNLIYNLLTANGYKRIFENISLMDDWYVKC